MSYAETTKIKDNYGWTAENTPMDELRVAEPVRLVGSTFVGTTIDSNFWTTTIAASGGTIAVADQTTEPGAITLFSKTDATGSVILQSKRIARYTGGSANRYRAQVRFGDTGLTNNTKRWGAFDGTNGAYFKLAGTTLSVCTMKGSSETAVASASWNGSTTTPTLTNNNTFEIYFTNSKVYFVINGVLVHTVTASASTWTATTNLPARADNINSGNTTDTLMAIRVHTIYRLGNLTTQPTSYYRNATTTGVQLKYGAGNIHSLIIGNVATSGAVVTLYDGTGTGDPVIANFTFAFPGGGNFNPVSIDFKGLPFFTGLFLVNSTQAAALTVVYE